MARLRLETGLVGMVALVCSGCAAKQEILGHPVRQQVAIVVHISDEVNEADHAGGVAELVETLTGGLKDHGMDSQIYTDASDHPPPPRIDLNVVFWSETSQISRDLRAATAVALPFGIAAGVVGPNNRMVVDCNVVLDATERRVFSKRIDVGAGLAMGDRDEASAGGNAGSKILEQILKR